MEHVNVNESRRTGGQFTEAVLKRNLLLFLGGAVAAWANETNVNKCLGVQERRNNRSGVFSGLHSTATIGSSPPASLCPQNDWKE
jgi:hypothetical protein